METTRTNQIAPRTCRSVRFRPKDINRATWVTVIKTKITETNPQATSKSGYDRRIEIILRWSGIDPFTPRGSSVDTVLLKDLTVPLTTEGIPTLAILAILRSSPLVVVTRVRGRNELPLLSSLETTIPRRMSPTLNPPLRSLTVRYEVRFFSS